MRSQMPDLNSVAVRSRAHGAGRRGRAAGSWDILNDERPFRRDAFAISSPTPSVLYRNGAPEDSNSLAAVRSQLVRRLCFLRIPAIS